MIRRLPFRAKLALLDAYNVVWTTGNYPDGWRRSLVTAIPKKGSKSMEPDDYRPISLTSCIGKVMERMINRRLSTILREKNLLDERQYAFQRGKGAGIYLANLGQVLHDALSRNLHVDRATLDLAKAYNRVWNPGVLKTLIDWGITGNMVRFVKEFLSNRTFQVSVGNHRSQPKHEETGVPQGSVLAVTLFLVSMNSVFERLPENIFIFVYADDILLVTVGKQPKTLRKKIQAAVRAVAQWSNINGFNMSLEKCAITHCCNQRHHPWKSPVTVDSVPVPYRKSIRVLGVHIDRQVNFALHFENVKKASEGWMRIIRAISGRHQNCNRGTILRVMTQPLLVVWFMELK